MTMPIHDDDRIRAEAYDWVAELTDADVSPQTRDAFEQWRRRDPRHDQIYARVARTAALAGEIPAHDLAALRGPATWRERLAGGLAGLLDAVRPHGRWSVPRVAVAGLAAMCLAVVITGLVTLRPPASQVHTTAVAEIRDVLLADGSTVTLGARSRIDVRFTDGGRHVRLLEGEAFFSVASDAARPFFVAADETLVRVVGTKFGMRRGPSGLRVAVEEGVVEVSRPVNRRQPGAPSRPVDRADADRPAPAAVLTAGKQIVSTTDTAISADQVKDIAAPPSAWRDGRLIYENASFSDIIADINRYYHGQLVIISDDLADLRFSSVFRTDEIDSVVDSLPAYLPVELIRQGNSRILIRSLPARRQNLDAAPASTPSAATALETTIG